MLRSISSKQFLDWVEYAKREPLGRQRADYHAAQIVAMIANVNRDTKRRSKPYTLQDFLLKFEADPPKRKSPDELFAILKQWALVSQAPAIEES